MRNAGYHYSARHRSAQHKQITRRLTVHSYRNLHHATDASGPGPEQMQPVKLSGRFSYYGLVTAAVVVFAVGMGTSLYTLLTNREVQAQIADVSKKSLVATGDNPSEQKPAQNEIARYIVATDQPRYIKIHKTGVSARVKPVSTKDNNELQAPSNIYDAGWFIGSTKPGQPGATLLDGHVHGPTKPGVFHDLKRLEQGDVIEVERGDGTILKYSVVSKRTYKSHEADMKSALLPVTPGKSGLNIITCAGKFNSAKNTYEERLIVFTTLID